MMKYRSRNEIVSMILATARDGATKTKIMYKAYVSFSQLKEYLTFMEQNELIRYEDGTQLYRVTEKGMKMARLCEEIDEMISTDDRRAKIMA